MTHHVESISLRPPSVRDGALERLARVCFEPAGSDPSTRLGPVMDAKRDQQLDREQTIGGECVSEIFRSSHDHCSRWRSDRGHEWSTKACHIRSLVCIICKPRRNRGGKWLKTQAI